jgi:hypothetical protein
MKPSLHLSKKAWIAVLFVLTLLVWCVVEKTDWRFATSEQRWSAVIGAFIVFLTSALAAHDSTRVHLRRYESGISYGPVGLFVVCALSWPFGLIWYLVVRVRIRLGRMPEKRPPSPERADSPSGLVQPWRQRRI